MKLRILSFLLCSLTSVGQVYCQSDPAQLVLPFQKNWRDIPVAVDYNWNGTVDYLMSDGTIYLDPGTPQSDWMLTNMTSAVKQYAHDFNGDDIPDLLLTDTLYGGDGPQPTGPQPLKIAINDGSSTPNIIELMAERGEIVVADLDGDSDLDIVSGSYVLYNDGAASFTSLNIGGNEIPVTHGDIDGDGLEDIVLKVSAVDNHVGWRRNLGSSFGVMTMILLDGAPLPLGDLTSGDYSPIAFFDLDNDGVDDLLRCYSEPSIFYLEHDIVAMNDGAGVFTMLYENVVEVPVASVSAEAVDFDLDGDMDVITGGNIIAVNDGVDNLIFNSDIATLYIEGSWLAWGTSYANIYELPGNNYGGVSTVFGQVELSTNHLAMGLVAPAVDYAFCYSALSTDAAAFPDDYDNNGSTDFVLGTNHGYNMGLWAKLDRNGPNRLGYRAGVMDHNSYYSMGGACIGYEDLDNDGIMELITGGDAGTTYVQFPSSGVFSNSIYLNLFYNSSGNNTDRVVKINSYDLNNDGYGDALVQDHTWPVEVMMNDGGEYVDLQDYTTINYTTGQTWASGTVYVDINADDIMDIWSPMELRALLQNPGFTFDEVACPIVPENSLMYNTLMDGEPSIADINEDGYDDILINGFLLTNDGGSQFNAEIIADGSGDYQSVFWDYDADGDLDIVLSKGEYLYELIGASGIYTMENLGGGVFDAVNVAIENGYFYRAETMDWDENGDQELLMSAIIDGQKGMYVWGGVSATVDAGEINGILYADVNTNNSYDSGDQLLAGWPLTLTTTSATYTYYTNQSGEYHIQGLNPGNYTINTGNVYDGLTIADPDYSITLNAGEIMTHDFRYTPFIFGTDLVIAQWGVQICSQVTTRTLRIYNNGTTTPDAVVTLDFSTEISYVSSDVTPTSVIPGQVTWSISDIPAYTSTYINLNMLNPGPSAEDPFVNTFTVDVIDDTNAPIYSDASIDHLLCSFDPNDIRELTGHTDQLYVSGTDVLDYVIRFQNTGTAAAMNVVLENQLPPELDWTTLQPTMWSHQLPDIVVDDSGLVTFAFNEIYLPDSGADLAGSQGFVRYTIRAISGLVHGTGISNVAAIYFDENEPVITNIVVNHIFDCNTFNADFDFTSEQVCFDQVTAASYSYEWADSVMWSDNFPNSTPTYADQIIYPDVNNGFTLTLHAENALCGVVENDEFMQLLNLNLPEISIEDEVICVGETDTLVSNFTDGNQWYLNNELISSASQILVSEEGDYSLVISEGDCISNPVNMTIYVNNGPTEPQIEYSSGVLSTAFLLDVSYQWFLNGEAIEGATNVSYQSAEYGSYAVVITNGFGCATASQIFVVNEIIERSDLIASFFPNPAHDVVNISFRDAGQKEIRIISPDGKLIEKKFLTGMSAEISLYGLVAGQYTITIVSDEVVEHRKLMVE